MKPYPSWTATQIVALCARLRLACESIGPHGIEPQDVSLNDVSPAERTRLLALAEADLWAVIGETPRQPRAWPKPVIVKITRRASA